MIKDYQDIFKTVKYGGCQTNCVSGHVINSATSQRQQQNYFPNLKTRQTLARGMWVVHPNKSMLSFLTVSYRLRKFLGGHAFDKHVIQNGEFTDLGINTPKQFANHIENVMNKPPHSGKLDRGRSYTYDQKSNTVVFRDPNHPDGGTAFRIDPVKFPNPIEDYINKLK